MLAKKTIELNLDVSMQMEKCVFFLNSDCAFVLSDFNDRSSAKLIQFPILLAKKTIELNLDVDFTVSNFRVSLFQ